MLENFDVKDSHKTTKKDEKCVGMISTEDQQMFKQSLSTIKAVVCGCLSVFKQLFMLVFFVEF